MQDAGLAPCIQKKNMNKKNTITNSYHARFIDDVSSALGIDTSDFANSCRTYFQGVRKRTKGEPVALKEHVAEQMRNAWIPKEGVVFEIDKNELLDGTAEFAALAAIATARVKKKSRGPIEQWWGNVATAIVGVDRTTEIPILNEAGDAKVDDKGRQILRTHYEGPGRGGIVFNNRGLRDAVIMRYGDQLNRLNPPRKKS